MNGFRTLLNRIEDTLSGGTVRTIDVMKQGKAAAEAAEKPCFHAVAIKASKDATVCAAAKAIAGHRFLSAEAPVLPLPDCDAFACTCTYQHYKDRRRKSRRADDQGMSRGAFDGPERRSGEDRRKSGLDLDVEFDEPEDFIDAEDYFSR